MSLASLARLDGVAQAGLVARGELSPAELLEGFAARLDAVNPLLRAVVAVDLERATCHAPAGPFAGVPFLVKDVTPYPGLPWRMGSRLFTRNVAPGPTPFSERLDAAGLVTVGKSATSELGLLGSTETLAEGVTHNPWSLSHSAAGSSGGAAAAVAAGLVPLAHANDGGGSIRIPASVCGLFGLKPSRGRLVPAHFGASDFLDLTNDGCVSRSVRDSALFLALTEAEDGPLPKVGHVTRPIERRLRIASWSATLYGTAPHPDVRRAHAEAEALVASLGHEVVPVAPPPVDPDALGDAFFLVAGAAVAVTMDMVGGARGTPVAARELEPFTRALAERFRARGPASLDGARAVFGSMARLWLEATAPYDAVLTPTLATPPWRIGHLSPIVDPDELLRRTAEAVQYTPIHNIAGCPGMSVPLHVSPEGLPIGVHFGAAPGAEALLLGLAYELEEARPWRDRWAPYAVPALEA